MTPELYEQVCQICYDALSLETNRRGAFLDQACAGDASLRREVDTMLAYEQHESSFLAAPALTIAADQARERLDLEAQTLFGGELQESHTGLVLTEISSESTAPGAPGMTLGGRYVIDKELGQGGICAVFLARDQKLYQTPVVIKVLLKIWQRTRYKDWLEKKFKGEIAALARIDHPGVVRALDVGELPDGRSYLVMQYVHGESLRALMTPEGMELKRVARLMRQMGQAVTAAHRQGVIHRDLKPENIMLQSVGDEEYVKLIDFGIATVYEITDAADGQTTAVIGTRNYVAPEQLRGKPVAASDIYALGVIAYELVTGQRPFDPASIFQLSELQRSGVRVKPCELRPELPESAQAAILKALSFAPEDRFNSAKDFTEALARALTGEPQRLQFSPRHRRWLLAGALIVLAAIGLYNWRRFVPVPQPEVTIEAAVQERSLSYWMEARPNARRYPQKKSFAIFDTYVFGVDDQLRFYLESPQSGFLYLINEGPKRTDGLPDFILLFPGSETDGVSPEFPAGQVIQLPPRSQKPDKDWFFFDHEEGIEKMWLVWSARRVPELEAVRKWVNPKDLGAIKDSDQRASVALYLTAASAIRPEVKRDETGKQTRLTCKGETLVWVMKLQHK